MLATLLERYGTLAWRDALEPARHVALGQVDHPGERLDEPGLDAFGVESLRGLLERLCGLLRGLGVAFPVARGAREFVAAPTLVTKPKLSAHSYRK